MYRVKIPKPLAILGVFVAIGMLIFVWTALPVGETEEVAFLIFFTFVVIAITSMNLWAAFHPKGSIKNIQKDAEN